MTQLHTRPALFTLIASLMVLALALPTAHAQDELARSPVKFFTVDHSVFKYDESRLQLEAYALIDRGFLGTESAGDDGGVNASYEITFQILQDDSLLIGDSWVRNDYSASDSLRLNGQKIPELVKYMIAPGSYRLAVRVVDRIKNVFYVEEYPVSVNGLPQNDVAISDILLASRIEKSQNDAAEFNHNGLLVLPNAERMFGATNPQIYYYVELYNLTQDEGATYTVDRALLDDGGEVIRTFERREREVPAADVVDVDAFSAATLRTGVYTLRVQVTDNTTGKLASTDRRFWIYRPEEEVTFAARVDPGFDVEGLTEGELDTELQAIRYLLGDKARRAIRDLDGPTAKRTFLSRFWVANDPDTSTVVNEFRNEYLRRIEVANERYGTFQREGWHTDRGRVLLMHGEADHIDDHPFDSTTNGAWQVWEYNQIEGGVIYVFVDRNNLGEYTQVHSTKNGEVRNPDWYRIEFSR